LPSVAENAPSKRCELDPARPKLRTVSGRLESVLMDEAHNSPGRGLPPLSLVVAVELVEMSLSESSTFVHGEDDDDATRGEYEAESSPNTLCRLFITARASGECPGVACLTALGSLPKPAGEHERARDCISV
jgi:hypothetical protein